MNPFILVFLLLYQSASLTNTYSCITQCCFHKRHYANKAQVPSCNYHSWRNMIPYKRCSCQKHCLFSKVNRAYKNLIVLSFKPKCYSSAQHILLSLSLNYLHEPKIQPTRNTNKCKYKYVERTIFRHDKPTP